MLAPYLVLKAPVSVGPWEPRAFRKLQQDDDGSEREIGGWVPEALRNPVMRLVAAYRGEGDMAALGAFVVPKDGRAGDPFDRALITCLGHALLAGSVANNPLMTLAEDERAVALTPGTLAQPHGPFEGLPNDHGEGLCRMSVDDQNSVAKRGEILQAGTLTAMPVDDDPPGVGDDAPRLELPALDGGTVRLEDHRGRPVLVCFLRHAG